MTKSNKKPESTDVVLEPFFVPEYQITVMATSPAEAVEIAKAQRAKSDKEANEEN